MPTTSRNKIEVELEMGLRPQVRLRIVCLPHARRDSCSLPNSRFETLGELTADQFCGIFRLTYNRDVHIMLKPRFTRVKSRFTTSP